MSRALEQARPVHERVRPVAAAVWLRVLELALVTPRAQSLGAAPVCQDPVGM